MRQARGKSVASAEVSAPVTSSGSAASPSDCDSSSQRRTFSRSVSTSRLERLIAHTSRPSTTIAASAIEASSSVSACRGEAKTALAGRSMASVQPGAFELA